jgi:hypothetical protein
MTIVRAQLSDRVVVKIRHPDVISVEGQSSWEVAYRKSTNQNTVRIRLAHCVVA